MMSENLVSYVLDAQQGNEDAFAKLYSRTLKNSYYLCLKLTADSAQAEEILKKGYAAAFCSIGRLKRPEAFEAWLKQKIAAVYKSTQSFYFGDADAGTESTASEFLPASVLDDDSLCRRVEDYVAYLPAEQRTVAVLYYCVGMPVDFIAKFLNVSPSTVDFLLSKAREGISQPLNLGDVTLSEDTLPVLTKIFQRSSSDVKIDNELVRQTFIYAIDCFHNNENPLDETTVYPDAQPAQKAEPAADEGENDSGEQALDESAQADEPETKIIEDGVKPTAAVTGDDLLKEINRSITEIAGSPLLGNDEEEDPIGEGIYISQLSPDEPDEPAQQDIPVVEKNSNRQEKNKTKLFIAIAAILLALVVAAVIALAKRGKSGGDEQTTLPAGTATAAETVKQEWREVQEFTKYSAIEYFNETCCKIQDAETGKWGLMNYKGEVVIEPQYYSFERCSYGRDYKERNSYHYVVQIEAGGEQYEVNMSTFEISSVPHTSHQIEGDTLDSKKYSEQDRFHNGYAAVRDAESGKWGYISQESGKLVIECLYETVNDGLENSEYQKVDYCLAVENGMVAVKKGGKMGVIDLNGKTVVNFDYTKILQGDNGVYIAQKNNKWGVILVGNAVDTYDVNTAAVKPVSTDLDVILRDYEALDASYEALRDINVRTEIAATGDETIMGTIAAGETVKAVAQGEADNGRTWICIEYNDGYGWLSAAYLDEVQ